MASAPPAPFPHHSHEKQPRTFKLTVNALLALPYRLCNPPPAVGKVRSCQVTPMFEVKLEDVLNRKHLPPLGLKDFEEWLLFVEGCPENLYFVLWLKEYAARYNQWKLESRAAHPDDQPPDRFTPSPQLTMSYLRAKKTFFTPAADYELNVPSDILAPFHTPHFACPHPDPIVFAEVAWEVHGMLKESLDRFVIAAYNNVGTRRAICGIAGGITFALLGSVAPLVVNIVNGRSRWLRLLAIPGLWLGLTILLASLHGVCMMIYVFGDLRQLRNFELERPQISPPKPLDFNYYRRAVAKANPLRKREKPPTQPSSSDATSQHPMPSEKAESVMTTASRDRAPPPPSRSPAATICSSQDRDDSDRYSSGSSYSGGSGPVYNETSHRIFVSPAYYDSDPAPEGPATRTGTSHPFIDESVPPFGGSYKFGDAGAHTPECRAHQAHTVTSTAAFIRPYEDDDNFLSMSTDGSEESVRSFDFDALPPRVSEGYECICARSPVRSVQGTTHSARPSSGSVIGPLPLLRLPSRPTVARLNTNISLQALEEGRRPSAGFDIPETPLTTASPITPARAQYKCNLPSVLPLEEHPQYHQIRPKSQNNGGSQLNIASMQEKCRTQSPVGPAIKAGKAKAHTQGAAATATVTPTSYEYNHVKKVPAFGPVTKVLSPVISRAQWEIVVRSAAVAAVMSVVIVGALLAVPVRGH